MKIMKIWMMTFGFLALAATSIAQDSKMSGKNQQGGVHRTTNHSGELYGKLVSSMQSNNELVRFSVDPVVRNITKDPNFFKAMDNLKSYRFDNVLEALNVLASHGWVVRSSMVVRGRTGDEQHYLLARPMDRLLPASPWLDERNRNRTGQK